MGRSLESRLSDLYVANFGKITDGWPAYVNNRRREAMEKLTLEGIPGYPDEAYRHFDLSGYLEKVVGLTASGGGYDSFDRVVDGRCAEGGILKLEKAHHLILDNGACAEGTLTRLPDGTVYGSLLAAAGTMGEVVEKYLDSAVGSPGDAVTALCSVFSRDGAFVYIPPGVKPSMPIHIDIRNGADDEGYSSFARSLIIIGEGARAELVISHSDTGSRGMTAAMLREIVVLEGAAVDITESVSMRPDSVLVAGNYMVQHASSRSSATAVWLGGGAARINVVGSLSGRDAESSLYGLSLGSGDELCDINMKVLHEVPDCRSNEVVKSVVSGRATASFTGMVYVAPDAQHTAALQQSRNLQLSDSSRVFTEPQLEIYADDVKCSHGATVGQLNEEEIYYMRQRGIGEKDARKLQLRGFVNDVISRCSSAEACETVSRLAEERIAEL